MVASCSARLVPARAAAAFDRDRRAREGRARPEAARLRAGFRAGAELAQLEPRALAVGAAVARRALRVDAGLARRVERAGEVEALRHDDRARDAEHGARAGHRVEGREPRVVAEDVLRRHALLEDPLAHAV